MDSAFLSILTGRAAGRQVRLGAELVLGRGQEAQLGLQADDISRIHARISRSPGGELVLEDLSSRNGTRVNGQRITHHVLRAGDRIQLGGETLLLFTRRSQVEEDLLESQRLDSLARLAGGLAHDFNNLLAVILGNTQLVRMHDAVKAIADPEVGECLGDALDAVGQARELVRQLLGFARRGRWEERPVEVAGLVNEVAELLHRTLDPRIRVLLDVQSGLFVMGDRQQLFQMVVNLCLNARDSMPSGGTLSLSTHLEEAPGHPPLVGCGSVVHLEVRDTGEGMDEDTRLRVFEPFFTTRKGGGRGLGLGLAVVHGVVASHGGQVWVESEPGLGTLFHVALPALLKEEPQEAVVSAKRRTKTQDVLAPGDCADPRGLVLVVDDDTLVRRGVARILRAIGYEVELAGGGAEALELFPGIRARLAFVLLDLVMPGMEGQEVLSRLLALDPEVRVVVMSGHHDELTVERLTAAGARAFLAKPFEMEQLQAVLNLLRRG